MEMKLKVEKKIIIQELISEGKTDEVFKHIDLKDKNILLVKSRYNSSKNQYHLGVIDHFEWQKIQNQINDAILDFVCHPEDDDNEIIVQVGGDREENKKKNKETDKNRNGTVDISKFLAQKEKRKSWFSSLKTQLYILAINSSEAFGFITIAIGLFLMYISVTWLFNSDKSKELILLLPSGLGSPDYEKPILSPELMLFIFGFIVIVAGFVCTLVSQLFKERKYE